MAENNNAVKDFAKGAAQKAILGKLGWSGGVGFLLLLVLLVFAVMMMLSQEEEESSSPQDVGQYQSQNLTPEVMAFEDGIREEVKAQGLDESVTYIMLSILQQESGGSIARTGGDIFQSSESMSGGQMGVITDPNQSIYYGVKHFKDVLEQSNGDEQVAIQAYNFGTGFVDFVGGGEPSLDKRFEFSSDMAKKPQYSGPSFVGLCRNDSEAAERGACYGDPRYLDKINDNLVAVENPEGMEGTGIKGDSASIEEAIDAGHKWLGAPYVWGGGRNESDVAQGRFDCSSFVRYAYSQAGVDIGPLTGTTTDTLINQGESVPADEMQRGDLIFFDTYKINGHVGIYLGEGNWIGAQSSSGVSIETMDDTFWSGVFNGNVRRVAS